MKTATRAQMANLFSEMKEKKEKKDIE